MTKRNAAPLVIVNPVAGAGATHDAFRHLEHRLFDLVGAFDVAFTESPGDAKRLTTQALRRGVTEIIVAGGDGTLNEVVNGWFDRRGRPFRRAAHLTLLPGGTGGDFRQTLGIHTDDDALAAIASGEVATVDVGVVRYRAMDSEEDEERRFINIASIGLSSLVDQHVSRFSAVGGAAAYVLATAQSLFSWSNPRVAVEVSGANDSWRHEGAIVAVAIANGRQFGGGLVIAPNADPFDGQLDLTVLGDMRRRDLLRLAPLVFEGGHTGHKSVHTARGHVVSITGDESVCLEVDGEPVGRLPLRAELTPGALRIRTP